MRNIITDLIALSEETEWVEFKQNNDNPEMIGENISALSNGAACVGQDKGYLIWGVDDKSKQIIGTNIDLQKCRIKGQELENWLRTQLEPRVDFLIENHTIDNKQIVILTVDAALNTPVKFKNIAYVRVGSYTKKLIDFPEKERKIWLMAHTKRFEDVIAISKLTQTEVLSLIDYKKCFELMDIPMPQDFNGVIEKLIELEIVEYKHHTYSITNLGALLFAADLSKFKTLSRKAIRLIYYQGYDRINAEKEKTGKKGYAVGFQGLIEFVTNSLPANEEISAALRNETSLYPLVALREFIANAIIHQDLTAGGVSPMIEVFKNRIEITNPGKPLIDILRFIDHTPCSRNEKLASLMRRMGICEERGSGIDRAIGQCEIYQLPAPKFINGDSYTRVILYSSLLHLHKEDKIRACYQHCCLKYISTQPMTNETVRERFGIERKNYPMASRIISDTIDAKLVKPYKETQSKKFATYVPFWA